MKKVSNLLSSLSSYDTSWKDKTPIISTETVTMVTNLSKTFLQIQSIFIVSNPKQIILFLRRPWCREKKLLTFKSSYKTFTQNTRTVSSYWHLWHQLIVTNKNPGLESIWRAQLIIQTTHLHFRLPCNNATRLLGYYRR